MEWEGVDERFCIGRRGALEIQLEEFGRSTILVLISVPEIQLSKAESLRPRRSDRYSGSFPPTLHASLSRFRNFANPFLLLASTPRTSWLLKSIVNSSWTSYVPGFQVEVVLRSVEESTAFHGRCQLTGRDLHIEGFLSPTTRAQKGILERQQILGDEILKRAKQLLHQVCLASLGRQYRGLVIRSSSFACTRTAAVTSKPLLGCCSIISKSAAKKSVEHRQPHKPANIQ